MAGHSGWRVTGRPCLAQVFFSVIFILPGSFKVLAQETQSMSAPAVGPPPLFSDSIRAALSALDAAGEYKTFLFFVKVSYRSPFISHRHFEAIGISCLLLSLRLELVGQTQESSLSSGCYGLMPLSRQ